MRLEDSRPKRFAICLENKGYPASLELRKIYEIMEDARGAEHGFVRVVDESGEDYLYPASWFVELSVPRVFLQKFAEAG